MELKQLDCPFCEEIGDWEVHGVEFVDTEIYMQATCPKCKKEVVISIPVMFHHMKMFVTPKNRKYVRAAMAPVSIPNEEVDKTETSKEAKIDE